MKPATPKARKKAAQPLAPPAMEQVILAREHEHMGKKEPPGTPLLVHPETARWLRAVGVVSHLPTTMKE
ncbi:hypothetical protein [Acidovorax sp.]|uniref:DUF7210 family protein n=1 Tax=Acidovorax sp. TaxID=1872122 RepID=UPI0027B8D7C3|nr:hypothetical protein [Acidovorax sp.]